MSGEENVALLERYISEVWEANPEAVRRFAAESFRRHRSPLSEPLDREEQVALLKGFRDAFPDITIDVEDVVAADDRIAFRSTMRGHS